MGVEDRQLVVVAAAGNPIGKQVLPVATIDLKPHVVPPSDRQQGVCSGHARFENPTTPWSEHFLSQLRRLDAPTIGNIIELFGVRLQT